ncbi:MAG: chorismate mutase [Sphingobacteriales bacterium SCN 48-20]|jgi:prephenate dehydratase|uniref:prephenate dehydratase n=1 Tax=Terrimonas ferruginea TaxID=249 RepID=UPI00086ACE18|nr:prephenate dehydratase [Terrimonas ferruginea]MBN8784265.1 prephenate dehydratase [Terrimonas ferruginea]ODT92966.1 MAG: chorismate mutase [Sphingobacteriales bacterium SCN 48-20]OJW39142.1 MAG: chorismate mutase [Sphingobacteriales bacterium 48-107]
MQKRISIQGYEGSFHQVAARLYFGKEVEVIPCDTFREAIRIAESKKESEGGIMAIENSIAGSILPNYNLLQKSQLRITGEIYLQIRQNLLVNPGVKLEDIREVHSHTMALQQCYDFLDQHKWKLVETEDTALSARHIHQHKSKYIAAIASKLAAELYDLEMIAPNIHTLKNNYTRFLVLQREEDVQADEEANKASINFHTDHSRGSLAKVLGKIADGGINLSKLQSFPIPGSEFRYSFHADMEFDNRKELDKVIKSITPLTDHLRIYGVYKRGVWK